MSDFPVAIFGFCVTGCDFSNIMAPGIRSNFVSDRNKATAKDAIANPDRLPALCLGLGWRRAE